MATQTKNVNKLQRMDGSDLDSITRIVEYYLEEGGTEENIVC